VPNFRSRWLDWTPEPCDAPESERKPFVSFVSGVSRHSENVTASPRTKPSPESLRYGTDKTDKRLATPFAQLESDWKAALTRAFEGFDRHAVEPSAGCLEGAAMLELWIADGKPPRPGATLGDLRDWAESVYGGRSIARLTDTGRVVLRSVPTNLGREGD
jgi:hypothetical protein